MTRSADLIGSIRSQNMFANDLDCHGERSKQKNLRGNGILLGVRIAHAAISKPHPILVELLCSFSQTPCFVEEPLSHDIQPLAGLGHHLFFSAKLVEFL